ncbi:MAG: WYL domain-containing protein [Syntrophaceticus sp.]|nr:WYL domain-containing protein [Syntrophaceticus sp.]
MTRYPRTGTQPETLVKILITVIEKTPAGGASMDDLLDAYAEINDHRPSVRTIYRLIRRLNLFFDPLSYGEKPEPGEVNFPVEEANETVKGEKTICSSRRNHKTYYTIRNKKNVPSTGDATMLVLSMYPQLRGTMKSSIEAAMHSIFRNSLSGLSTFAGILSELEHVVYVSGAFPADPMKSDVMIRKILLAIKEKKRVRISYLRTYDGTVTERQVEPHGLLCRLNNWYLTGRCTMQNQRRVFLLLNIQNLTVLENSSYSMPPGFSLKETYQDVWGTWTEDDCGEMETVRLEVCAGPAERFRRNLFHESQQVRELSDGRLEVSYRLNGAQEMISWLMSWGDAVIVLEPTWLREQLLDRLQEIMNCYRQK